MNFFLLLLNLNKKSFNSVSSVHWTLLVCLSVTSIQLNSLLVQMECTSIPFDSLSVGAVTLDHSPHLLQIEVQRHHRLIDCMLWRRRWMDTVAVGHWIIHLILLLLLIESRRNEIPVAVYGQINSEYTYILSVRKAPPPSSSANSTQEVTIKAQ